MSGAAVMLFGAKLWMNLKTWRLKRGATPQWYKQRNGVRAKALSGAARVARFRPRRASS